MSDFDTRDAELRRWARKDWGDALELAELWASYWTDELAVWLSTERAGFLARSFLAALHEMWKAEAREAALRDALADALDLLEETAHGKTHDGEQAWQDRFAAIHDAAGRPQRRPADSGGAP